MWRLETNIGGVSADGGYRTTNRKMIKLLELSAWIQLQLYGSGPVIVPAGNSGTITATGTIPHTDTNSGCSHLCQANMSGNGTLTS